MHTCCCMLGPGRLVASMERCMETLDSRQRLDVRVHTPLSWVYGILTRQLGEGPCLPAFRKIVQMICTKECCLCCASDGNPSNLAV